MAPFHLNGYSNTGGDMAQNHGPSSLSTSNMTPVTPEALEIAGRCTESMLALDAQFPTLAEKLRIGMLMGLNKSYRPTTHPPLSKILLELVPISGMFVLQL